MRTFCFLDSFLLLICLCNLLQVKSWTILQTNKRKIIEIESNQKLVIDHLDSKIDLNVKLLSNKIDEVDSVS